MNKEAWILARKMKFSMEVLDLKIKIYSYCIYLSDFVKFRSSNFQSLEFNCAGAPT